MVLTGEVKPLPKSTRYLNYAKAAGATISAAIAISAFVIANWYPVEPVARAGYQQVEKTVAKMSLDMQRAFDAQKLNSERIDGLRQQMGLMLDTLHAYMATQPGYKSLRTPSRAPASGSGIHVGAVVAPPLPAAPKETPKKLLQETLVQSQKQDVKQEQNAPRLKAALSRPPDRKLPTLKKLEEQIQVQAQQAE